MGANKILVMRGRVLLSVVIVVAAALSGWREGHQSQTRRADAGSGAAMRAARALLFGLALVITAVTAAVAAAPGTINTVAGNGVPGSSGDGGPATSAMLNYPGGVGVDAAGNLYIADTDNNRIRKVDSGTGIITTVAGTGTAGYSGDGGPATSAMLANPSAVAFDAAGNLYIADTENNRIRKVDWGTGIITTVAGDGAAGYSGDGGPATSAMLSFPLGVGVDAAGNLYVADSSKSRVRKVDATTGIITTVAGKGGYGYSGDGGPTTALTASGIEDPMNVSKQDLEGAEVSLPATATDAVVATVIVGQYPTDACVDLSRNHLFVANYGSAYLSVLDGSTFAELGEVATGRQPVASVVNQTTRRVYTAEDAGKEIRVYNADTLASIAVIPAGKNPTGIALNPVTNRIYAAMYIDNTLWVINGSNNAVLAKVNTDLTPLGVAVDETTNLIYVCNHGSNDIQVFSGVTNAVVRTIRTGANPRGIALNIPAHRMYVTMYGENDLWVYDLTTYSVVAIIPTGVGPRRVGFNPANTHIFTSNTGGNSVTEIDGVTNTVIGQIPVGLQPRGGNFNPITSQYYSCNSGGNTVSVIQD